MAGGGGGGARWAGLRRGHSVSRGTKGGVRHLNHSLWRLLPRGYLEGAPSPPTGTAPSPRPAPPRPGKVHFLQCVQRGSLPRAPSRVGCQLHRLLQAGRAGWEDPTPSERESEQERVPGREGHRCPALGARRRPVSPHSPSARPLPSTKVSAARGWGPCRAPPQVPASPLAEAIHGETGCGWGRPMSPWRRRGGVAGCPDGPVLGRGRGRRAVLTWTWAAGTGGGAGGRACFRPGPVGAAGAEIRRAPPPRGSAVVRRLGGLPARLGGVGGWGSSWPLPNACLGSVFLLRLRGLCFVFAAGLGLLGGGRLCCPLGFLGCRRGAGRGPCYPRYQDCA